MRMACMENPLSLWHFYLRNKRKVLPVIGILALAILGVVVTDSLLASARETAYATYGSYQKVILVAPRALPETVPGRPAGDRRTGPGQSARGLAYAAARRPAQGGQPRRTRRSQRL